MSDENARKVAVVTGASSGIGQATAEAFAGMGWHVIGTGRDPERSKLAEDKLRAAAADNARIDFLRGDFCEMREVKRVAEEIRNLTNRVDILVNNAGGVRDARYVSSDGLEATMAANHFASFLLTRELMPLLKVTAAKCPPGTVRVLAVASAAHEVCEGIRWDDLNWDADYAATPIYCQAKLANILFTRELNRRVADDGIIAQAMHPGVVETNFFRHGDEAMQTYGAQQQGHPPEHSAQTLVWMATAPEVGRDGGRYFYDLQEVEAAPQARDDKAANRLWVETERILDGIGH